MCRPMMFSHTATISITNDPAQKKCLVLRQPRGSAASDVRSHRRARQQESGEVENGVGPVRPSRNESVKIPERHFRPDVQPAFFRKSRRKFHHHKRRRDKKQHGRQNPQTDRRLPVARRRRDPPRPQHRGDAKQQHVPESHRAAQLMLRVGMRWARLAHDVTSNSGMSSSCRRKLRRNGSGAATNPAHGPK